MSHSDKLRKMQSEFGGGRQMNNDDAVGHEKNLAYVMQEVKEELEAEYADLSFEWVKRIFKFELAQAANPKTPYKQQGNSFITPDGGMLSVIVNGKKYPLLVTEAKKQGTNSKRIEEGLKRQGQGNAIERAFKNIMELQIFFRKYDYFPYVMFCYGCDFAEGSSILDRLDAATKYEPRNVNYVFDTDQKTTIFVQEQSFTKDDMKTKLKDIAIQVLEHITNDAKG